MSKYMIDHRCGHSREVQLYGKMSERDSKAGWMAEQDCPQCWGAAKREDEAKQPISLTVGTNGLDTDARGNLLAEIYLGGGTMPRKEEIKALGYHWREVRGGVMSLLSMSRPSVAWVRQAPLLALMEAGSPDYLRLMHEAEALGAQPKINIGPLDLACAQQSIAKQQDQAASKAAQDAQIAAINKPVRPACHPRAEHPDAAWNGKYYGNDRRGWDYYAGGHNYKLTADEYAKCMAYRAAIADYDAKIEQIKKGV